ncbi:protein LIAT1 [Eublepharis macularius]|uniref:Protein LIAT1 n=1 Tax=Eublepharis macularius TaxID=481883 RepID=A0AA97LJN8_EUBMA|nr:protein LIAT1 [Eublepharis macularius]
METCWLDPLPYAAGGKVSKPQGKEPPPAQQTLGKKKTKKKKKKSRQEDAEKQPGKSKKQPVFLSSPELLHLCSNRTTEDDASKDTAGRTARQLSSSTSNFLLLTEGNSDQSNESLRWNGILDDPAAEEERLWQYRLNRRKRYGAYIQQSLPPEPSLTLKHLPQLCKFAHLNSDHLFGKTELATSQNSKT